MKITFKNKEFRSRNSRAERGRISDIFLSRECASPGGFLFDRKWSNFLSNKKSQSEEGIETLSMDWLFEYPFLDIQTLHLFISVLTVVESYLP